MELLLDLHPDATAPGRARAGVDRLVGRVPAELLDDLRLVLSELVTNAVVHGPCDAPVKVRLAVAEDGGVRGEVADQGDGVVEIREAAGEGGGYGLRLLDTMADRWGVRAGSTHVWFELRPTAR